MHPATLRQLLGLSAFVALLVMLYSMVPPEEIIKSVERLAVSLWIAVPVFLVLYLIRPFLAWPVSAISIVLGYLYGPFVLPLALAGTVVSTIPLYLLARYLQHDAGFLGRVGEVGRIVRQLTGDIETVTAVRLSPLPTDAVSYAFGLSGMPFRPYIFGTTVGEAPWVITAVLIGASASQLAVSGVEPHPVLLITTLAIAALLLLARPAYRRVTAPDADTRESLLG